MNTGKANELFIQVKRVGFAALIDEENLTHFFRHYHEYEEKDPESDER